MSFSGMGHQCAALWRPHGGDQFQKHNYPFGILVNARGKRYVDEGANFHSHTYASMAARFVRQPGMFAWQVFDAKASPLLRGEYRSAG